MAAAAPADLAATPPKPPDIPKSFASIVAGNKQNQNYIEIKNPTTFKGEPAVFFTDEEINKLAEPFKYALVGKFPNGRPSMVSIRNFFARLNLRADYKVGLLDSKHILIHLHNEEDYHRIWLRNQWNIFQYPMTISKWHVNFTPDNESPIMPVWVAMPYLPPHMFREDALMSLAKTIGNPMRIDNSTATLARPSKARVCVEVDISKNLPKRSYVGQGNTGFWQYFHYEELPLYCSECNKSGHESSRCIMKEETDKNKKNQEKPTDNTHNMIAQNKANTTAKIQKQVYIQKSTLNANNNKQHKEDPPQLQLKPFSPRQIVTETTHQVNQQDPGTSKQQVTILKRGIKLRNSFSILDPEQIEEENASESESELDIETQDQGTKTDNQEEQHHQTQGSPQIQNSTKSNCKEIINIPKSLDHLQLETGNREVQVEGSGVKVCSESLMASDDDLPRESYEVGKELIIFTQDNTEEGREEAKGKDNEDKEKYQKITNRKKNGKAPTIQRNLRSNAKADKSPVYKPGNTQNKNHQKVNDEDHVLEH